MFLNILANSADPDEKGSFCVALIFLQNHSLSVITGSDSKRNFL